MLREDLSLHHRSFHREASLMRWLDYWDQRDKADRMGVALPPRHPLLGAEPPKYLGASMRFGTML